VSTVLVLIAQTTDRLATLKMMDNRKSVGNLHRDASSIPDSKQHRFFRYNNARCYNLTNAKLNSRNQLSSILKIIKFKSVTISGENLMQCNILTFKDLNL